MPGRPPYWKEGGIKDSTILSADIKDLEIVNADLSATAAIAFSKLAALDDGKILIGNASNVAVKNAITGDITLSNAGVVAIATGVIVDADVNASAAIAYSKLALTTSIVNGDLVNSTIQSGKISYFKSTEQTGSGSEQDVAHGLGRTPALVLVIPTSSSEATAYAFAEGTHDGTNAKVTATNGAKYIVLAL